MIELKIDGIPVTVEAGATVLEAAEIALVEIPTLCHLKGLKPETSCMLCVVKDLKTGQLIPACSTQTTDGMELDSQCETVQVARRDILNLLLSEHVGDCEAPCTRICPAHLDIPRMLREIARGNLETAAWIAQRDLAIPSVLSHICPAPCEKGCRRAQVDQAITIRKLHRTEEPLREFSNSQIPKLTSKRVAVVGSGAAGLACAWQLRLLGYGCAVFDEAAQVGGVLRENEKLPAEVLDAEIQRLMSAGIEFRLGKSLALLKISEEFDSVVFAAATHVGTAFSDAFYVEEHKLTVKAVANGKAAAFSVHRALNQADAPKPTFDSKIGKLRETEVQELVKNCPPKKSADLSEAEKCLHCDCRKPTSCKLRNYAEQYGANQREFFAEERGHVQLIGHNEAVVYELGKCIKCGLCVKITQRAGEKLGLTFMGRGFNTQVAVPFDNALQLGLRQSAEECVAACPTGALAFREAEER